MRVKYARKRLFFVKYRSLQARNQGGRSLTRNIFPPQKKCVGRILKLLDTFKKICPPLRKLFAPLVPQAGYGPGKSSKRLVFLFPC